MTWAVKIVEHVHQVCAFLESLGDRAEWAKVVHFSPGEVFYIFYPQTTYRTEAG